MDDTEWFWYCVLCGWDVDVGGEIVMWYYYDDEKEIVEMCI